MANDYFFALIVERRPTPNKIIENPKAQVSLTTSLNINIPNTAYEFLMRTIEMRKTLNILIMHTSHKCRR